jgi:hypothetical protein
MRRASSQDWGAMDAIMKGNPTENGFYMPAEWEPHAQTWMGWPVRPPLAFPDAIFAFEFVTPTQRMS